MARFLLAGLALLIVCYSAWFITWYAGVQSGHGSPLPPPPYANLITSQSSR